MEIYKAQVVQSIQNYYGAALYPNENKSIGDHLEQLADMLMVGLSQGVRCLYNEVNNYHPQYLGKNIEALSNLRFNLEDSRITIANEYGFTSWKEVEALRSTLYNMPFEKCVNHLLSGDKENLLSSLSINNSLTSTNSQYGHKATLLHYVASNGVEMWRQQVPLNLLEMVQIILEKGADKNDLMHVYKGQFTAFSLFTSSAHPIDSGIQWDEVACLLRT